MWLIDVVMVDGWVIVGIGVVNVGGGLLMVIGVGCGFGVVVGMGVGWNVVLIVGWVWVVIGSGCERMLLVVGVVFEL